MATGFSVRLGRVPRGHICRPRDIFRDMLGPRTREPIRQRRDERSASVQPRGLLLRRQVGVVSPRSERTTALGRKHERRTTRRDRDPDARFSAKRSRARDSAGRGGDLGAGGVGFGACFHAEACVRPWRGWRSGSWPSSRPAPAPADASSVAIAVVGCPAGSGTNAIVRRGAPSALLESSVAAACDVMGAEQDSRDVRSSASSAGHGTLLDHAWSGSPGVDAVVTALVLAASRCSVRAPSHDRTDPSATRSVRACGELRERRHRAPEPCIRLGRRRRLTAPASSYTSTESSRGASTCGPGARAGTRSASRPAPTSARRITPRRPTPAHRNRDLLRGQITERADERSPSGRLPWASCSYRAPSRCCRS